MERLSAFESLCLDIETPDMPMNVSSLTIYDPSSMPGGRVEFADIQKYIVERVSRAGVFRRHLAQLPLAIARPYWVDDPGFDIEFHVRHIALPRPGDWRQLCTQVARLHARPLDRKRPLWECYVIEELANVPGVPLGSFAVLFKAHLAALGGPHAPTLFTALHELAPDAKASAPKERRYFDHAPSSLDLLTRSVADALATPAGVARFALRNTASILFLRGLSRQAAEAREGAGLDKPQPADLPIPRTRFNRPVTAHRVVEGVRFPMADIDRIAAKVPHATPESIAFAVIAGGLRKYLDARMESPGVGLVASVTLDNHGESRPQAGSLFIDSGVLQLCTDIEDPLQRLRSVVALANEVQGDRRTRLGRRLAVEALDFVPEPLLSSASILARRLRLASRMAPVLNTSIARVRGPEAPLYFAGAPLVSFYGFSFVDDLAGLSHVIGRYHGEMTIGVTACRAMLPDPDRYAACLNAAYQELADALHIGQGGKGQAPVVPIGTIRRPSLDRKARAPARARSAAA